MKKFLRAAIFVIISLAVYLLLYTLFPKNRGIISLLLINIFLDAYLWGWVRKTIQTWKPFIRRITGLLFWFPMLLLIGMVIYGFFQDFLNWNIYIKTYIISLFFCFFSCTFFPIVFLLLADIIRLIKMFFCRIFHRQPLKIKAFKRYNPLILTGWIFGGLLFFLLVFGMIFWQYDFRVREQVIRLPHLPMSFDGFRIVQFSDVHLGDWPCKKKLESAVQMINNQHPDVIFFTGDMFNYCTAEGKGFQNILKKLHSTMGIYTILGNHDYGDYIKWPSSAEKAKNMRDLEDYYNLPGWKLLRNGNTILRKGGDSIAIIGVENWGFSHRFQRLGDIEKARKGTEGMDVQLLLSHDPAHWEHIISRKYQQIDITFSGHSHGGQFGIDAWGLHWSPVTWFSKYWGGLYQNPESSVPQYLYVNEGLGCIGYSGRVGILPEITVFVLKRTE